MNVFAIIFLMINAALVMSLPRRWASLPLLVGACYMTMGQGIEIGPFTLTVLRLLIAAGVIRVILRGELPSGGLNSMDLLIVIWSVWMLFSSYFHEEPYNALITRLGLVYNAFGIYFLIRVFCQSLDDIVGLCRIIAILLVPVALEMLYETLTQHNLFSALGRVPESPVIRAGRIRAQGPFAHSILAGTIGAVCLPFAIILWKQHRIAAITGLGACSIMILTSSSSGPIMSSMAAIGALIMWHFQHQVRVVRWLAVLGFIALDLIMKDPAYFILARINVVGGSTGWHRAMLIQSAFEHLPEWWLGGTDYTRHWMAYGVPWSANHVDITNYYLNMGVVGGVPLMLLFIAVLSRGFSFVGRLRQDTDFEQESRFIIWALGSSLFAHAVTFISVSYFDQSFLFIYLTLAAIASIWSATLTDHDKEMPVYDPQYDGMKKVGVRTQGIDDPIIGG